MKKILKLIYLWSKKIFLKTKKCVFENRTEFDFACKFEGYNLIAHGTYLSAIHLGYASYIGNSCLLRNTYIGRYTCIGPNVTVAIGRHPTSKFVSIHPAFYSNKHTISLTYVDCQKFEEIKRVRDKEGNVGKYSVCIGNDVWIGANVTIMDGITIGDGAIVGAGAIVTNDVEPYSVVIGIPAKPIRSRFTNDEIDMLLELQWWNKEESWIKENADFFEDIGNLKDVLNYK